MTYRIEIKLDEDPYNPREYFAKSTMALFHKRYALGDDDIPFTHEDFNSWEEMKNYIEKHITPAVLPVYMYDHSGITIKTTPFSCPWDSGQIGFVYMTKEKARSEEVIKKNWTKQAIEKAKEILIDEVHTYDTYLTGEVYGYIIYDENDDEVDSCWGYYDFNHCKEAAEAFVNYLSKSI